MEREWHTVFWQLSSNVKQVQFHSTTYCNDQSISHCLLSAKFFVRFTFRKSILALINFSAFMDAISIGAILQFLSGNLFKSLQNISHFPTFFLRQPINEWGNCFALLFTLYSMTTFWSMVKLTQLNLEFCKEFFVEVAASQKVRSPKNFEFEVNFLSQKQLKSFKR